MDWPSAIAGFMTVWLFLAVVGVATAAGPDFNSSTGALWAIFFWPVTVPIFLVTGLVGAILYSIIMGCKIVGGKV